MATYKFTGKPMVLDFSNYSPSAGKSRILMEAVHEMLQQSRQRLLDEKSKDALTAPGFAAAFDPEEAEAMGAFAETAITEQDAIESAADVPAARL
jgi:hypothetical protein